MKTFCRQAPALFSIIATVLFYGCGGGSSSTDIGNKTVVSGVVVDKGPGLANATVTIKDSLGAQKSTTTAADGTYSIDASSFTAPFVLTVTGTNSSGPAVTLVAPEDVVTASTTNTINITPWTTAIAAALSSTGVAKDLDPVKDKQSILSSLTVVDNYTKNLLAPTLVEAGYAATQGPIATAFAADGTGYDSIYSKLVVGSTPSNAVFMADSSAAPCTALQISGCVAYSDPGAQTATNPNVCGSDIATGTPIPCDSASPMTSTPPTWPQMVQNSTYTFGCIGCIYWGSKDDFSLNKPQTPLTLAGITPLSSTGSGSGGGTGTGGNGGGSGSSYYWANWSCGSSSQCASLMGGSSGSAGPMCTATDCSAWGNKYIGGGYACSTTATSSNKTIGVPANGTCYKSGVDF